MTTAIQKTPEQNIAAFFNSRKESFAAILPKHLTADRLLKVALNCILKNPALVKCTQSSLMQAVVQAAELGLEPGGALGHAYLVPYGNICTLIIGYRGLIDLSRRSGQLAQVEAHVVHEGDEFKLEFGITPVMRHVPKLEGTPGKPLLVYMLARLKDGSVHCEVMTMADVERVRARSKSGNNGPWATDYEEMAKKTVIRRGFKYLPMSTEIAKALEIDDEDFQPIDLPPPQAETQTASKGNEKAKAALKAKNGVGAIVDIHEGETEEQAKERALAELNYAPGEAAPHDAITGEVAEK